ncbi:hypothetical protein V5O48_019484, partial [Marasmius crinis-equi]
KTRAEKALERHNKLVSLETFLDIIRPQWFQSSELDSVTKDYDVSAGHLDDKATDEEPEEREKIAPEGAPRPWISHFWLELLPSQKLRCNSP